MPTPPQTLQPVASRRHTLILCAILLVIAGAGALSAVASSAHRSGSASVSGIPLYLPLLAAEWGLFYYVRLGLRGGGTAVRDVISGRPLTLRAVAMDLVLGAALLGLWLAVEYGLGHLFARPVPAGVQSLLVRDPVMIPLWLALALSAGFVEEFAFRGYLQRQFGALLRNRWLGVAAQALLFGVTHGYQGGALVLEITIFGLLFGAFALVRQSLIPGMFAHAAVDVIGGLALFR
jgi:membrane protease YdiL (CAAX protease family)